MKIIDLLNKIANGEETPKKFKFASYTFEKIGYDYLDEDGDYLFDSIFRDFSNINDEIEIIEEPKKIERLIMCINRKTKNELCGNYEDYELKEITIHNFDVIHKKINEIIDYICKEKK